MKSFSVYNFYCFFFAMSVCMDLLVRLNNYSYIIILFGKDYFLHHFIYPVMLSRICKINQFSHTGSYWPTLLSFIRSRIYPLTHYIHFHRMLMWISALVLDLFNFQLRTLCLSTLHFICLVTSHWSDRSVSFSTCLQLYLYSSFKLI